ncbi:MAG: YhbY family RNA-binding protein [Planctomycetes bacterium]|nr:YhbY family RNA-binding protein [Planctomycetota bacterium]
MTISNADRRSLRARANRLKSNINVGREGVNDAIVQMIRNAFTKTDLIKVRIHSESGPESDEIAKALALAIPCNLIARTGHVATLHRQIENPDISE